MQLLRTFTYIQKYHEDNFDVLYLLLEFLLIVQNKELSAAAMQAKGKSLEKAVYLYLETLGLEVLEAHKDLNVKKVLKDLRHLSVNVQVLEKFIQAIALQKTILRLYEYATPAEVNALVRGLLDLKVGESVYNPCCGLGSWLLSVSASNQDCTFYGVDIHPKLIGIAKALARLLHFKSCMLQVGDIFKQHLMDETIYDKIFCHPPMLNHLNVKVLKESQLAPYNKTAPEIPFLDFALKHFKQKAVFIVRTSLLSKRIGGRLCKHLLDLGYLEAVIELPDNVFPCQMESFCLLILSKENKRGFFIDASHFYLKEGKYHKLINVEEILDLYASKQNTSYSLLLEYCAINPNHLKPSFYLESKPKGKRILLDTFLIECYRGARVAQKSDSKLVGCYDFGIKDFNAYGFSDSFGEYGFKPQCAQMEQLKVAPYDVLLSMRGVTPKVTIIGESAKDRVILPNAGILVLRFKESQIAKVVYLYFISKDGQEMLSKVYGSHNERMSEKEMKNLSLPAQIMESLQEKEKEFYLLCNHSKSIAEHLKKIKGMLGFTV